jgi:hypothetical protein
LLVAADLILVGLIMQVIEAQCFWSWSLTITSTSTMTGYPLGVVKLEPNAAVGSFALLAASVSWPGVSAGYMHTIGADGRDDIGIGRRCNPGRRGPFTAGWRCGLAEGTAQPGSRRPLGNNREDVYGYRPASAHWAADRADRPRP